MCLAAIAFALPAAAEGDYETTMAQLEQLQGMAEQYVQGQATGQDPIQLTLTYVRANVYNTSIWQLTAGVRDASFVNYVDSTAPELVSLRDVGTLVMPNGDAVDFDHLLASLNLVYDGIPLLGSWGGDCAELAQTYLGQASDEAGYIELMQASFNQEGDPSLVFSAQDLRADLDAVIVGGQLAQGDSIAASLRAHYTGLASNYDRVYAFTEMTFGNVDTADTEAFADRIYTTLAQDTGMQLLLYRSGLLALDGWQITAEAQPALRAACTLLAQNLSTALGGERIRTDRTVLMTTRAPQALADALTALGDDAAANAALDAQLNQETDTGTTSATSRVDEALTSAAQHLQTGFDAKIFQIVLLAVGSVAALGLVVSLMLFFGHNRR